MSYRLESVRMITYFTIGKIVTASRGTIAFPRTAEEIHDSKMKLALTNETPGGLALRGRGPSDAGAPVNAGAATYDRRPSLKLLQRL